MFLHPVDPVADRLVPLGINRAAAERLSQGGTLLEVAAGTTLCRLGDRGLEAFLLIDGTANVLTDTGVIVLGPGEVVGEIATLDPARNRNATVVAATDMTVLVFDARTFRGLARVDDLRDRLAPARAA